MTIHHYVWPGGVPKLSKFFLSDLYSLNLSYISGFSAPLFDRTMQISWLLQHVLVHQPRALIIQEYLRGCGSSNWGGWQQQLGEVAAATRGCDSSQKGCEFSRTLFKSRPIMMFVQDRIWRLSSWTFSLQEFLPAYLFGFSNSPIVRIPGLSQLFFQLFTSTKPSLISRLSFSCFDYFLSTRWTIAIWVGQFAHLCKQGNAARKSSNKVIQEIKI